jgi:hypothetical protein
MMHVEFRHLPFSKLVQPRIFGAGALEDRNAGVGFKEVLVSEH